MDFDCIYKSYYLDVYHFLCGLSSNKEIAEDITQETFTKALTAINSYDGRKDIRAWLFTIARNTYFTYCKREKIYVEWEPPTEQVDIQTEFIDNLINKEQVEQHKSIIEKEYIIIYVKGEKTIKIDRYNENVEVLLMRLKDEKISVM